MDIKKSKMGKKFRAEGKDFEVRVFQNLLNNLHVVPCRWNNDVKDDKIVQARTKWRKTKFGMFPMNLNPGFPDFIIFSKVGSVCRLIIGVECKINNKLDKIEEAKVKWYLENKIFDEFWVAYKTKEKNRVKCNYREIKLEELKE